MQPDIDVKHLRYNEQCQIQYTWYEQPIIAVKYLVFHDAEMPYVTQWNVYEIEPYNTPSNSRKWSWNLYIFIKIIVTV